MLGFFRGFRDQDPDQRWRMTFAGAFGIGIFIVLMMGLFGDDGLHVQRSMAAMLLAGASGAVGAFLGFLFGIPRSQQGTIVADGTTTEQSRSYAENTNLEQISDWLTKIIVGLTLVQFGAITDFLKGVGTTYGPAILGPSAGVAGDAAAMAIVIYFFMVTLLFVYLWTRIYVETLFRRQSVLLDNELEELINKREEDANSQDAEALQLTDEFLDSKSDPQNPKFATLEDIIAQSSFIARTLIFEQAREARRKAWKNQLPAKAAKAVPIFRGLIKAAPDKYHRNYGQLGYAIINSPNPDWAAARDALESAIRMRGKNVDASGTGTYEFTLAIALINLDPAHKAGKITEPALRSRIAELLDLSRVAVPKLDDPDVQKWAKRNKYEITPAPTEA